MVSSQYYRRQSDLCLQLALLQADPQTSVLLVGLAKELRARAEEVGSEAAGRPTYAPRRSRALSGRRSGNRHQGNFGTP
jgi:hypothetical protein